MIKALQRLFGHVNYRIDLPESSVAKIIEKHQVHPWFLYIFKERASRWDVSKTCAWIAANCDRRGLVFETGCGCALNLIWLGQQGFSRLAGIDIQKEVIEAGKDLSKLARLNIDLWTADGLQPNDSPDDIHVLLALNWTSLIEHFHLAEFLNGYSAKLRSQGYLIFDAIDSSYNHIPDNQYLTSDWGKPENERKPSEYKTRLSQRQVADAARHANLEIAEILSEKQEIPKAVYILRKTLPAQS